MKKPRYADGSDEDYERVRNEELDMREPVNQRNYHGRGLAVLGAVWLIALAGYIGYKVIGLAAGYAGKMQTPFEIDAQKRAEQVEKRKKQEKAEIERILEGVCESVLENDIFY